ncbi:MAG: nucleotidyl transferase AbiEii/AbiGii toxin family protein [bacterium]
MSIKIIEDRLKEYSPVSSRDELHALKEITQEIALSALARVNFFNKAAFQGGSCLRIVHGLNRFSEDLDFILFKPDRTFVWEPFLKSLQLEFKLYSLEFDVIDRSKADKAVKMAFLKENSFGKVFVFTHPRGLSDKQTIKIKLEIDTNPAEGSEFKNHFINFPYSFSIISQNLPSLFASKCHALLCRPFIKGRDWFDFVWYVSKKVVPNYVHLTKAIDQEGPWKKQNVIVTKFWLIKSLTEKIEKIDWVKAKYDVENFLRASDRESLKVWGADFFLDMVKKL